MIIHGIEYPTFRSTDLRNADLSGADLSGLDFRDSNLRSANFQGANLTDADFRGADLSYANFGNANLTSANLRRTTRYRWVIEGANTEDAAIPCDECERYECECVHCGACGQTCESRCERCEDCSECCTCAYCERCESRRDSSDMCGDCDRCTNCCTCSDEPEFRDSNPSAVHTQRGKRLAGVEYETTERPGSDAMTWARKWGAGWHTDGSCGYEAVTPPCAGTHIDHCIAQLADVIGETDSTCGIHVHVDARDYRWSDTYRFLRVFAKVEGLLYVLAGQQRITNTYCPPCGKEYLEALESPDPKNAVLAMAYGVQPIGEGTYVKGKYTVSLAGKVANRHNPGKKLSGRYKSLNIAPWVFGRRLPRRLRPDTTFEFRLHRNGDGAERVIGWTHLCIAIVDWCVKASDAEVTKLPRSPLRALCQIAPGSKAWILRRIGEWRRATPVGKTRRVSHKWAIKVDPQIRGWRLTSERG